VSDDYLFGALGFLAAFGAGWELSQMTPRKPKYRPDQKGAALAVVFILVVLALAYFFGSDPPMPD
jgi:hypothetical protein